MTDMMKLLLTYLILLCEIFTLVASSPEVDESYRSELYRPENVSEAMWHKVLHKTLTGVIL